MAAKMVGRALERVIGSQVPTARKGRWNPFAAGVTRLTQGVLFKAFQRRETVISPLCDGMPRHYISITADFPDPFSIAACRRSGPPPLGRSPTLLMAYQGS